MILCSLRDIVFGYENEPVIRNVSGDIHAEGIHCRQRPERGGQNDAVKADARPSEAMERHGQVFGGTRPEPGGVRSSAGLFF